MQREIDFMRRETEQLRSVIQATSNTHMNAVASKISLTNLKEMFSFDGRKGSYQYWKEQLLMLR